MAESIPEMQTSAGRMASFEQDHRLPKRRASSQRKKAQNTNPVWPHTTPTPEELAKAGFFYEPLPSSDDNVKCFHCKVKLDGWEAGDNAIDEHAAHSSECQWALSISVGKPDEERDPNDDLMVEARKATYGELWPHESKKGWKCKIQKMVEAGWCFDPSPEQEDGVTCFYCNLSLDGWEPKDNPSTEHRKRSPDCAFFVLVDRYAANHAKPAAKGRGRTSRGSKASRLSTQSMQSTFSEAPSYMSLGDAASTMDIDNTVATVATITSTTGKGRKKTTKASAPRKKDIKESSVEAPVEYLKIDASVQMDESMIGASMIPQSREGSVAAPKPATKTTRGKAKTKNATRAQQRTSQDQSQLQSELDATAPVEPLEPVELYSQANRGVKRTSDGKAKTEVRLKEPLVLIVDEAPGPKPKKGVRAPKGKKGKAGTKQTQDESEVESTQVAALEIEDAASKPKRGRQAKKAAEQQHRSQPEPEVQEDEDSEANFVVHETTPLPEEFEPSPTSQKQTKAAAKENSPEPTGQSAHSTPRSASRQQSSDAENQPPPSTIRAPRSLKDNGRAVSPAARVAQPMSQQPFMSPTKITRVPLAASTPNRSPSKQSPQKLAQIVSRTPWAATDLETIFFPSPDKGQENVGVLQKMTEVGGALTSPEKKMTVKEWVEWRAAKAEEGLRRQCERMVSLFESEGGRGLQVLAGIEVQTR